VAGGQILGFSIDLLRRPYNTLALPCECVIIIITAVCSLSVRPSVRLLYDTCTCSLYLYATLFVRCLFDMQYVPIAIFHCDILFEQQINPSKICVLGCCFGGKIAGLKNTDSYVGVLVNGPTFMSHLSIYSVSAKKNKANYFLA